MTIDPPPIFRASCVSAVAFATVTVTATATYVHPIKKPYTDVRCPNKRLKKRHDPHAVPVCCNCFLIALPGLVGYRIHALERGAPRIGTGIVVCCHQCSIQFEVVVDDTKRVA